MLLFLGNGIYTSFFSTLQSYTTLRRALMTDFKNINDTISILTATIKFIQDTERFHQTIIKDTDR